jgi:hypothetical protein
LLILDKRLSSGLLGFAGAVSGSRAASHTSIHRWLPRGGEKGWAPENVLLAKRLLSFYGYGKQPVRCLDGNGFTTPFLEFAWP